MMYKRQCTAPPNPISLEELQLKPDEIKTYSNKSFLFCDTGPGPNRIVLFATKENIVYLSMSSIWLEDETFKTVPALLLTVYSSLPRYKKNPFIYGHLLQCLYALLPNKMQSTYTTMWNIIHEACPNSQLHYMFVDFEQAY